MPETVPWLYANGRLKEADAVLQRIVKWNRINLTKQDLEIFASKQELKDIERKMFIDSESNNLQVSNDKPKLDNGKYSITMLVRNR